MSKSTKVYKPKELGRIVAKLKAEGKTVGMITGCFDIAHIGHIQLFNEAKKHVDVLIIGLESDANIKLNKGIIRPILKLKHRIETLAEMESVNYIMVSDKFFEYNNDSAPWKEYFEIIKPNFLITNPEADAYWESKQRCATELNINFLEIRIKRIVSSSAIVQRLESNF